MFISWHLFYLDKYPIVDLDDACMAEPAWSYVNTGHFSAPSFEGCYGLEKSDIYHGRLYMLAIAPYLKIFGNGVYQSRLDSFLTGLFVLLLTYLLAVKFFSKKVALNSVVLLGLSGLFIITAHRARQEMLLTFFILLSLYLFLSAVDKKSALNFYFSGLLAGLSADIHLNGVILPIMLTALFIYEYRLQFIKQKGFWLCMAGIATGLLWWVITHILLDPKLFFEQWNGFVMKEIGTPGASTGVNPFGIVLKELKRYTFWFWSTTGHRNMVELVLLVCGLAGFLFVPKTENMPLHKRGVTVMLICIASWIVMFTLIVSQKAPYYIFLFLPFVMILLAKGLENLKPLFSKTVFLLLVLFYLTQTAFISMKYKDIDYTNYGRNVRQIIPVGSRVLADTALWFALSEDNFYSELTYSYYWRITKNSLDSYLKEKNIEYIAFGKEQIGTFVMSDYFKNNYNLFATVEDGFYGSGGMLTGAKSYTTEIYKRKN